MNITFLIGNGFDIGIGLKTRYEDFYQKYCNITNQDNDNIKAFKEMLKERNSEENCKIIDWADFETAFGQHSSDFSIEEKEIYLERFEDFISKFNAYLEEEEAVTDYSNEALISETMKNGVTQYFHIREGDKAEIQKIYNSTSTRVYNFISFNYTRTIDNCVKVLSKTLESEKNRAVGTVAHIHGYIDKNMIMGVNDPSQITNKHFATDNDIVQEIVKPQQNIDARTRYENEVGSIINSSDIICIYGMSIGATDKKWWNIISKWLSGNTSRRLVILTYDKNYNARFPHTQRRITNKAVDTFLSYSELSDDEKTKISSRIYVGCNHNVFSMELRKKEQCHPKKEVTVRNPMTFEEAMQAQRNFEAIMARNEEMLNVLNKSNELSQQIAGIDLAILR